ncbi:MAG: hypothetical protein Q4D37_05040 [Oscillospiraceae bacterium]|nr:hypothetical protein [Oscillospiraceae bacterium]
MNQKQCKRMFEQMQPPEAVVQRLQQKIHAEENAIPPSLRSARQAQIVRFTKASSKPPRPSWRSIATGATAAVLLLGIGTSIGYHLQKTNPFVPSSESSQDPWSMQQTTIQTQETDATAIWDSQSDAEKYDSLLYNGISWRKASALTDETTQLGNVLGEGTLYGSATLNDNTTISQETSFIPVYDVQIAGYEEQYAVAVKLDETYYIFTRNLETITTCKELPILESTISSASFSFCNEDTEMTYADISVSTLQPLFTFLKDNQNSMNLYTGLTMEAEEQNTQITDTLSWKFAISLDSAQYGFAGTLYFDVSAGIWKADMMDSICYFTSTPNALSTMLTNIQQNCESEGRESQAYPAFNPNAPEPNETTLDTTVQDLLPKLREAHLQFQKISGVMQKKKTAYMLELQEDGTEITMRDEASDVDATLSFQMDITNKTENVVYAANKETNVTIPDTMPDDTVLHLPSEQISYQSILENNYMYDIYPTVEYYRKSELNTDDWSMEDTAINLFTGNNGEFGNGIFFMAKEFSEITLTNEPREILLFGETDYLGRDCYILVAYQNSNGATTRYLIDKQYGISLKTETYGKDTETIRYFTEIAFNEQAEPVPAIEEESLLNGLSPLPDYIS